jgi:hypothetical protein
MKRHKHNLSHYKLATFDMGELVPVAAFEVLPGDTIQMATNALLRTQPMFAPVMHPVHVKVHHWFVPYRLIWDDFEKFITGGPDGNDASVYPTINMPSSGGAVVGSLADYLGVPPGINSLTVSALRFRAYAFIYNEFYRDQDIQPTALGLSRMSGPDTTTSTALQRVNWEKDYFTASRPWEQKGTAVTLPLGTSAPVRQSAVGPAHIKVGGIDRVLQYSATPNFILSSTSALQPGSSLLEADLSSATAASVNTLKQAFALQRFREARAQFGSRYVEYLRYLGVKSADGRLDLPEYLAGGKQTIQFSEVLQTAADGTNPVGTMRGHGIAGVRSNRFRRHFEEHGVILTLMSVRPKLIYTNGLHREFNRRVKEDFYQPEFEHIGQQAIQNREVYAAHITPAGTFGFTDRYAEYRTIESGISGEFRTTDLNYWHMAQDYGSAPALNTSFITCQPTERIFPVPARDVIYCMANHQIQARRMIGHKSSYAA